MYNNCHSCGDPCDRCNKCTEAAYDCNFSISAVPFDPTTWNVSWCGKLHKVKLPPFPETDTTLSINYSNSTLNYKAERHLDIITGQQLGSIINVGDLRDTAVDYSTDAMCYELIYHKYGACGEGCKSPEDRWSTFSIDNDGALGPQIRYVRGANRYGCPYFLDVPSNSSEYWFQGWRGDTMENGYYQPAPVSQLPTDSNGNYYVLSQMPANKQPVVGTLPWQCMITNIFGNFGVNVEGAWQPTPGSTEGFDATFDPIQGYWSITWTDWNDTAQTQRAGYGTITGKLNWDVSFDTATGDMKYIIRNIYYDKMTWTVDQGVTQPTAPTMALYSVAIPGGTEQQIMAPVTFGHVSVSHTINYTVDANLTVSVGPNQIEGPFNFVKIYVDWVIDDEGYMGVRFKSNIKGWQAC